MQATKQPEGNAPAAAQGCCAPAGKSGWLSSRNIVIGALVLGGAGGLLFGGWNWLVAAGFASIIIGLLPCLVMCGLGLCMSRMGKKDAAPSTTASLPPKEADVQSTAAAANVDSSAPPAAEAAKRAA